MEIKRLKSALKSQTALLSANAIIFAILSGLAASSQSWIWIAIYCIYLIYAYFKFLKNDALKQTALFITFAVLSYSALISTENSSAFLAVILVSSILFFIFLGAQLFYFPHTKAALGIFYHTVIFGIAAYFASVAPLELWWGALPLFFVVVYFCTKDYLKFETGNFDRRKKMYALAFSFLAMQCIWIASLLPFGFLNAALIVLVFSIICNDLFLANFSGKLTYRLLTLNTAFFLGFVALIFIAGSL